jgi:hypothetical protein
MLVPQAQLVFSLTLWDDCGESRRRLIDSEQMWRCRLIDDDQRMVFGTRERAMLSFSRGIPR